MRNAAFVLLAFGLLVLQSAFGTRFSTDVWSPNLLLPIVLYLGVSNDVHVVRGAALSFVLGYLLDSFAGSPMGLSTFVMVATFLVARGAGINLLMRGVPFQIALTFAFAVLAGGAVLALRAIFEPPAPFPLVGFMSTALPVTGGALVTALIAPLLFPIVRRIDGLLVRRREETASS